MWRKTEAESILLLKPASNIPALWYTKALDDYSIVYISAIFAWRMGNSPIFFPNYSLSVIYFKDKSNEACIIPKGPADKISLS